MYAVPVPDNQTCAMVNMSADPVEMMPGQLVGRNRTDMHTGRSYLNRHARLFSATVPSIPVSWVRLLHTLLLVQCN